MQALDLVRPPGDRRPSPLGQQRRVMPLSRRKLANLLREFQRLRKIVDREDASQAFDSIALHDVPVRDLDVVERDGIKRLRRVFSVDDFAQALEFTKKVGELAAREGHHPALLTEWGRTTVTWWTHKIKGLHRNDFIMAAKTDELYQR